MLFLAYTALALVVNPHIAPQMPAKRITEKFMDAKNGFQERWQFFQEGRLFTPFLSGKSSKELEEEFLEIRKTRLAVWFQNPSEVIRESSYGFEVAESLLFEDSVRYRNCSAFAYNNTVPYYNASTIHIGDRTFIACEAPREKDVRKFFQMIASYHITHLVRLTKTHEGGFERCFPYWHGNFIPHHLEEIGSCTCKLHVPLGDGISYPVQNYIVEDWLDQQGLSPERLISLVKEVKSDAKSGLIAVHCSAGVGRTGTFIAAVAIHDAIEKGEAFSIEEIVYRLSLQRINSVSSAHQYISLHRFAELALQSL